MTTMQRWVTAAALGLLAIMVLPATPAAAHAKLTASNPQAGSIVSATLAAVTLTFSGPVKPELTTIVVAGPDGVNRSTGAPTLADVTLTQPVNALPPGQIKVTWRTVSADGHTINGTFDFTNAAPQAAPSASSTPAAAAPATAPADPTGVATEPASEDESRSPVVWIVLAVLVLGAAAAGAVWYRRRSA
jgi:methionine-rich copper-binding protein CopC